MKKLRMPTTSSSSSTFPSSSSSLLLAVLTEDLLLRILTKVSVSVSDNKTWRMVCKDFLRLESVHRKTLKVYRHESLPSLLRRYKDLDLLDLSVCPRIDDRTVTFMFGSDWSKNLKKLNLSRANGLRSAGLDLVVRSCPVLEEIDVSYCVGLGDREASALSRAKGLKDLKLVKCLGVTDVGLANIVVACVGLEKLSLKWCLEISDLGIELLSKKCPNLRDLDISYLKVTNKSLNSISSLRYLESLSMVGCSNIDDEGLHFFRNGKDSIQSLDVSRCSEVSSSGVVSVIEGHGGLRQISASYCLPELASPLVSKLKHLKNLNTIKFDGTRVSAANLRVIGANCKNLVEIGLSKCAGVTDEGIKELVSGHGKLKTLDLTCCHSITDAALAAVAKSCKMLTCLKLESCNLITEEGLKQIGTHCSLLEEIDLTECSGVNDEGLKYLSKCSQLKCLKLGLCVNVSDKGFLYIGSSCSNLQELDLYGCTGISDYGIMAICSGCRKLKKLNLCYCNDVTDTGMKFVSTLEELSDLEMRKLLKVTSTGLVAIAAGCKSLMELDVKRCYNINDTGFWALAQYSPNLRQINLSYCTISETGLHMVMATMKCLQDAKLVNLTQVSVMGLERALRASCGRLKKVKLITALKSMLTSELLQVLQTRGCKIRWVDKEPVFGIEREALV